MSKGKKFNAAEKHFEEKCVEWRKKIRELEKDNKALHEEIFNSHKRVEKLLEDNEILKKQNKALAKLKNMSDEEIQLYIKSANGASLLTEMFGFFGSSGILETR